MSSTAPADSGVAPGSTSDADDAAATLEDVVEAFAELRAQNSRLVAALAGRTQVGPSDIRALFLIATRPGSTPKELSSRLGLTTGATTALLDRLDRVGLILRIPNPEDRRSIVLEATDRGRALGLSNRKVYVDAWVEPLADVDLTALRDTLRVMAGALRDARPSTDG